MDIDHATTVIVVLGTASMPPATINVPGTTIVVPIATTCEVEAQLSGAPGTFAISPPGYQPMSFLDSSVVSWRWEVTPERAGRDLHLELDINSLYQVSGDQPIPGSVRDYTALIDVTSTSPPLARQASGVLHDALFLTLLAALIPIALGAAGAYWHRRHKAGRNRNDSEGPTLEISERDVPVDLPLGFDQVVGRGNDVGIALEDPTVGRHHARVFRDKSGVWLEDLGSRNGTFVNGQRLEGPRLLHDGDGLAFAKVTAVFHAFSSTSHRYETDR
jgi:hypothetical protein